MFYLVYLIAGLGAGIVTGLAGLSAAVIITPLPDWVGMRIYRKRRRCADADGVYISFRI